MWFWLAAASAAPGAVLADGVVLDAERGQAYVAGVGGGIDAVRLRDGLVLWHSDQADFPLGSAGDLVIGWKDAGARRALRIVGLDDRNRGRLAVRCPDLPLPSWGRGAVRNTSGYGNRVAARVRDGRIEVGWQVSRRYASEDRPRSQELSEGGGTCDPATQSWLDAVPAGLLDDEIPGILQGKAGLGVRRGGDYVVPRVEDDGRSVAVKVDIWDAMRGTRRATLDLGTASSGAYPYPSADGVAVAVVEPRPDGGARTTLHDTRTGARITRFDTDVAVFRWRLVGDVLVSTGGDGVVAMDLDGRVLWTRGVRDRGFHGPYPD